MTVLEGKLADRAAWSAVEHCPIERALDVLGPKNALLLLREASYGTTRFDDFAARVEITEAAAAARLRDVVDHGLLARRPYREPGARTRDEYVLTESGRDLMPALIALFEWGQKHGAAGGARRSCITAAAPRPTSSCAAPRATRSIRTSSACGSFVGADLSEQCPGVRGAD